MLQYELQRTDGILILKPSGPLESADFEKLADDYDASQQNKAGYANEQYYIPRVREYFKGWTVQHINVENVERF